MGGSCVLFEWEGRVYCLRGRVVCIVCVGGLCVYCLSGRVVSVLFVWEGCVCIV